MLEFDENLNVKSDNGSNGSSDVAGTVNIRDTSASSGTVAGSGGNSSSGTDGSDSTGGAGGSAIDGSIELPGGSAANARANDPTRARRGSGASRARSGRGSNSSRSRQSASDRGREETTQGPPLVDESAPREVALEKLGGSKKNSAHSRAMAIEFLAEGWSLAFQGAGFLLRDKEWEVEKETDATELAERTLNWISSLDKKKSAAWEKMVAKWQPFLSLIIAIVAIVGPRIAHTRAMRRAVNLQAQNGNGNGAGTAANGNASSQSIRTGPAAEVQPERVNTSGNGHANPNGRSFRREDFNQFFGPDA